MSALVRGSHLGDEFIVDQELGSGSFGITYSVRALKDMPPYIRRGESYVIKEYFPVTSFSEVRMTGSCPEERVRRMSVTIPNVLTAFSTSL